MENDQNAVNEPSLEESEGLTSESLDDLVGEIEQEESQEATPSGDNLVDADDDAAAGDTDDDAGDKSSDPVPTGDDDDEEGGCGGE